MIITLDNVSCLLYIPIVRKPYSHIPLSLDETMIVIGLLLKVNSKMAYLATDNETNV